jgi:hypothetical protein
MFGPSESAPGLVVPRLHISAPQILVPRWLLAYKVAAYVAMTWHYLGATDLGSELGVTYLGAELVAKICGSEL